MISIDDISIENFLHLFEKIIEEKEKCNITAIQNNPDDLLERAKSYGTSFKNSSYGWSSNIWHRSAAGSVVVEKEEDLKPEHKKLMLSVLEHILARPMIAVDATLGPPKTIAAVHCRLYCDPQFPDIAYRWKNLNFPASSNERPQVLLFCIPHYLNNPNITETNEMLKVLRFPNHDYTLVTVSSYQGECKKGFLTHWITNIYNKGGTGEHASLKEFTIKKIDGQNKRVVMATWGLTGSGKSTHGLYVFNMNNIDSYVNNFGINPSEFVSEQVLKNDDIIAVFKDRVYCSESGSWTKTEDIDERQIGIYRAAMNPEALHENTEWDKNGNVSFEGKILQYQGKPNQNARTVLRMEDTGYYDNIPYSSEPLNMAIFISPGYNSDFAWLKINNSAFAAKVLADGRTTGHPAQSLKGVGEEKYETRYCLPFTMGVSNAAHVNRFFSFLKEREKTDNPIEVYQINTTGRVGTKFNWVNIQINGEKLEIPKTVFVEKKGKIKPIGGTGPSIEETELFLMQASRGVVKYEPHPIWGEKILVPVEVPGLTKERLQELNPYTYHSYSDIEKMLKAQIVMSKYYLSQQCPGLNPEIEKVMDF